ncbi:MULTISPECIES: hypothetical protein [unclassified Acinetobacter]|uniref:hypothetical protein n=1 Tax=unclassified Acinetobacter TaxID=196816 RepID=UPI00190BD737|nr:MULTISPECIES: hypothetical protein [unclassified Acinetobacter]MBK0062880.1 hypothetical protein [Acinetobacter sp. S55]MBK0065543.1 hypothetical protein [Acinetobacter sp. S54]
MTVSRTLWQNIQHYSWLVLGAICLLLALIFWAITSSDKVVQVEKQDIAETQTQIQPQKVTATTNLGTLSDEVRPLDLTMRVITAGNHEAEFRGTKFMQENQRNMTIELFRSSDENIIKNYLKSQTDRKNFIYFRLSGENQEEQYVLAYGIFNRQAEAQTQLSQLNLKLPASVHPQVVSLANYMPLVNDLGSEEIKGSAGQLYSVNLRNAPIPVAPAPVPVPNLDTSMATTSTTVTRRDDQGNVVDVQRQSNMVVPPSSATTNAPTAENKPVRNVEREISDPFN